MAEIVCPFCEDYRSDDPRSVAFHAQSLSDKQHRGVSASDALEVLQNRGESGEGSQSGGFLSSVKSKLGFGGNEPPPAPPAPESGGRSSSGDDLDLDSYREVVETDRASEIIESRLAHRLVENDEFLDKYASENAEKIMDDLLGDDVGSQISTLSRMKAENVESSELLLFQAANLLGGFQDMAQNPESLGKVVRGAIGGSSSSENVSADTSGSDSEPERSEPERVGTSDLEEFVEDATDNSPTIATADGGIEAVSDEEQSENSTNETADETD